MQEIKAPDQLVIAHVVLGGNAALHGGDLCLAGGVGVKEGCAAGGVEAGAVVVWAAYTGV